MIAVLDASAAVRLVTGGDPDATVQTALLQASTIIVPDLFVAEVTNALCKLARFADLPAHQADTALRDALGLIDRIEPTAALAHETLALAARLERPAYDLFYLVLARREAATLVTLDRRLGELARAEGVATAP